MMRYFSILILFSTFFYGQDVEHYRKNYAVAVKDKSVCESMIRVLEKESKLSVFIGYLGAYQTIWANHVINPMSKLTTFQKGKRNLEASIKQDPNNIELRFLRYSIQKNAPKFLKYYHDLDTDRNFILEHKKYVQDQDLKRLLNTVH